MSRRIAGMVVVIDTHNWFYALWHARRGQQVTAEITRRIVALRAAWSPTSVVAALDGLDNFRRGLYPEYKAHRDKPTQDLLNELDSLPKCLVEHGLASPLAVDGFEADDLLASIAAQTTERVSLCTSDKDLRQCLKAGRVNICRDFHLEHVGGHDLLRVEWVTAATHEQETGLPVASWIDYLSLVGDTTDNVQGAEGIGPKTATKILQQVGSLDAALQDLWRLRISDKQRLALFAFKERAPLVRQLVTCRTDVPGVLEAL